MGHKMEWNPPIVKTSTVRGEGVDELWDAIEEHRKHQEASESLEKKRNRRILEEVKSMVAFRLRERAAGLLAADGTDPIAGDLAERRIDPYRATEILLERVRGAASEDT